MAGKHSEGRRENKKKRIEEEEEIPKAFRKDGDNMQKQNQKQKKKHGKLKLFGKIVLTLVIILAILVGAMFWYVNNKLGKMQKKIDLNEEDLGISQEAKRKSIRL